MVEWMVTERKGRTKNNERRGRASRAEHLEDILNFGGSTPASAQAGSLDG